MQAALHTNMDGDLGLAGWQWLFIFNAIMVRSSAWSFSDPGFERSRLTSVLLRRLLIPPGLDHHHRL
jgi:hypothetical protein